MMQKLRVAALAGLAAIFVVGMPTTPASANRAHLKATYSGLYHAVAHRHGTRAPGRNIRRWGVKSHRSVRAASDRELARSIRTLRSMLKPYARLLTASGASIPPSGARTLLATKLPLTGIAACESGGNPRAVSPGGTYRGKYQFDYGTWATVGGSGDPAAASEAEQDRRAAMLYAQRGAAPWPVCGR
jgi:hypothetical protein